MGAGDSVIGLVSMQVRPGHPDFLDLPWHLALGDWGGNCQRLVQVPRGLSRHEVRFVSYGSAVYALKELPEAVAEHEYEMLASLEDHRMPAVTPVGRARVRQVDGELAGILVTRFLEGALPYRTLFQDPGLRRYRERLLDSIAGLLVRLHLAGFYWGDCSLSNTLFRRDAGELQAYLVDAETSEQHETLGDGTRRQDLLILEENVSGDLADLEAFAESPGSLAAVETGRLIRERYDALWAEVTREETLARDEHWRIQERIRKLNELGFSVGEIAIEATGHGDRLSMRAIVTDRDYHRHLFHSLTGVTAEERQAETMLNEIMELQATLTRETNRSVPLSVAAFHWKRKLFDPALKSLAPALARVGDSAEAYCQVLEHKWFLSERARLDVGMDVALADYLERFEAGA